LSNILSAPILSGAKYVSDDVIPITGTINYVIDVSNIGTKVSNGTWIVDNIPAKTRFVEAYTA
jgi:uncharacterized repeat protein (TIGR01451 family)